MASKRRTRTAAIGSALAVSLAATACGELPTGPARDADRLIQTDAMAYGLARRGDVLGIDIRYTFTNRTAATVYVAHCSDIFPRYLERFDDGEWVTIWSPDQPLCITRPPIIVEPGATFADTLHVRGGLPGTRLHPQFDSDDPAGVYRLVWRRGSHVDSETGEGALIPLAQRISNRFWMGRR